MLIGFVQGYEELKWGISKLNPLCNGPLVTLMPLDLLPTGSEKMEVLEIGSIPVSILPSCQYMKMWHHNCIEMIENCLEVRIRNISEAALGHHAY